MPKMFHKSGPTAPGQKVFLATPTFDGLSPGFTFALYETARALSDAGIASELAIFAGDCHVDDARNRLVRDFLETDCTDLFFIDADIRWNPDDLVRLCGYDRDVVAATYPFKQDETGFPVQFLPGNAWAKDGVIEVCGVPTGFLRIRRHVLESLAEKAVKFRPKSDARSDLPLIFERQVHDGFRRGGDYAFCYKWRQMGGRIYLDPEVELDHSGTKEWSGSYGHFKRVEMYGAIQAGIMEISEGLYKPESMMDMVKAWGNEWSVDASLLILITELAKKAEGPILELGSGISSLCMAAATDNDVHAIEHDIAWVERMQKEASHYGLTNLHIHHSPLQDYGDYSWYGSVPANDYSLILNDGPPRAEGKRRGLFENVDIGNATVIIDDAEDGNCLDPMNEWASKHDRDVHVIGRPERLFAISKAA